MQEKPLEVRLKVALEDCSKGKAPVVWSMTNYGEWGRAERLFMSGADEVKYGAIYRKVSDRAYFDDGLSVRDLTYRIE